MERYLNRRGLLAGILGVAATAALAVPQALADRGFIEELLDRQREGLGKKSPGKRLKTRKVAAAKGKRIAYKGRETVSFSTAEKPGTIIIKTRERALYYVLGNGKAVRYGVAVGKDGFSWAGTAHIGAKAVNPRWTPPTAMIKRTPRYAKWAGGMPGGIPENPLGARALYLYKGGRDTMYRIHGTNAPSSIGTAASSGCIRMLNHEVKELYSRAKIGTKVIVL